MDATCRGALLDKAKQLINSDRDKEYGDPWQNLTNISDLWSTYLVAKFRGEVVDETSFELTGEDVAHLNVLQKMARTFGPKPSMDTYVDMAAYSAIAGEIAEENSHDKR